MSSQVPSSIKVIVGRNIRAARLAAGLTQSQLAQAIGVPDMYVSKWERGKHRPEEPSMQALCQTLGMSYADLYAEPEELAA